MYGEGFYWLELDPYILLPTGKACSAYYGAADKPKEGHWILVKDIEEPQKDKS